MKLFQGRVPLNNNYKYIRNLIYIYQIAELSFAGPVHSSLTEAFCWNFSGPFGSSLNT